MREIDLPYTCHIGDEDVGSKIALDLDLDGERQDVLLYPMDKFFQLDKMELTRDIFERAQRPIGQKRKIIQGVFDDFLENYEWPLSSRMSVELRYLGDFFRSVEEIGTNFIRAGNKYDSDAVAVLTIYGVSLCTGSEEYISTFLKVLAFIVNKFIEMPELPVVISEELLEHEIIGDGQEDFIHRMMWQEGGLISGGSYDKGGNFSLTVSPDILKYETANTIDEYLRIAYSSRFESQVRTEAVERIPYDVIEMTDEGMIGMKSEVGASFTYDLFLSHSSVDRTEAIAIKKKAKEHGLECFLDKYDIKKGRDWDSELRDAIRTSREMAILVTPDSLESDWVFAEAGAAWVLEMNLTPILLRCDYSQLHPLLARRQATEYHEIDDYLKELAKSKNAP